MYLFVGISEGVGNFFKLAAIKVGKLHEKQEDTI